MPDKTDCVVRTAEWLALHAHGPLSQEAMATFVREANARLAALEKQYTQGDEHPHLGAQRQCLHFQWYVDSVCMRVRNTPLSGVETHVAKVASAMMPLADHQAQWQKMLVLLVMWPALLQRHVFFDVMSDLMRRGVVEDECAFGRQLRQLLRLHEFHIPDVFIQQLFQAACVPDVPFAVYLFADIVQHKRSLVRSLDALSSPVFMDGGCRAPYSFFVGTTSDGQSRWSSSQVPDELIEPHHHDQLAALLYDLKGHLSRARWLQNEVDDCERAILSCDFMTWRQHKRDFMAQWRAHRGRLKEFTDCLQRPMFGFETHRPAGVDGQQVPEAEPVRPGSKSGSR